MNLALLGASLLACVLILEIGVRFFAPQYKKIFRFDEAVGVTRIPNSTFTYVSGGQRIKHSVNTDGFKTPNVGYAKPEGTFRVVLLGDSMTEAIQVPDSDSFRSKLEEYLEKGMFYSVEVINLGYSGYGTAQEYLTLVEFGLRYEPDLVILNFLADNDVGNNSKKLEEGASKPFFVLEDGKLVQIKHPEKQGGKKLASLITDYLVLPRFLYLKMQSLKSNVDLPTQEENFAILNLRSGVYNQTYNDSWNEAWDITKQLIKATRDASEGSGAEFLLVSYPAIRQTIPEVVAEYTDLHKGEGIIIDVELPETILKEFAVMENLNFLSLLEIFKSKENVAELYIPNDGHLSQTGHILVAESIYEYLNNKLNIENAEKN